MVCKRMEYGFSLVEMAIVMSIIGLLFVGFSKGVDSFHQSSYVEETKEDLKVLKQKVLSFALISKYLPCPDTDGDGFENRSLAAGVSVCSAVVGGVPYLDLGLAENRAKDSWGNDIRYAVNTNASNASLICNKTQAASMFCAAGSTTGTAWFTLTDTPPLASDRGAGNYYICNKGAASCTGTPANADLESDTAVVVMVAYNKDGAQAINNCAVTTGAINENCDRDLYYHQAGLTSTDTAYFDDVITYISGSEVKSQLLSSVLAWNSYTPTALLSALVSTYEDFDITSDDNMSNISTNQADVVLVNRNVSTDLNLGRGEDYLAIGNDVLSGADINLAGGNDTLYIIGQLFSIALLGDGDDVFVLESDLVGTLKANSGNDRGWVKGDILPNSLLELNRDDDVLWLGDSSKPKSGDILETINGGSGYDILVLENVASWADLQAKGQDGYIKKFELIIFADDGSGVRASYVCTNDSNNICR